MGYKAHHSILVETFDKKVIRKAYKKAVEIFTVDGVSLMDASKVNCYYFFHVLPDGSNEGWEYSDQGDVRREDFIKYLCKVNRRYRKINWCEVRWAEDDHQPSKVLQDQYSYKTKEDQEDENGQGNDPNNNAQP